MLQGFVSSVSDHLEVNYKREFRVPFLAFKKVKALDRLLDDFALLQVVNKAKS